MALDKTRRICHYRAPMTVVCPRCAAPRDRREGPYYVCVECRWCWTISITGRVYVQGSWPRPTRSPDEERSSRHVQRLLASVEGLPARFESPWPSPPEPSAQRFSADQVTRLEHHRAAVQAGYFNEGVPLARLREEGIWLPPPDEDAQDQTPE